MQQPPFRLIWNLLNRIQRCCFGTQVLFSTVKLYIRRIFIFCFSHICGLFLPETPGGLNRDSADSPPPSLFTALHLWLPTRISHLAHLFLYQQFFLKLGHWNMNWSAAKKGKLLIILKAALTPLCGFSTLSPTARNKLEVLHQHGCKNAEQMQAFNPVMPRHAISRGCQSESVRNLSAANPRTPVSL